MSSSSRKPSQQENSEGLFVFIETKSAPSRGYDELEDAGQQIRLLQIEPADDPQAALVLSLQTASLHEKPVYDAISYRWGDSATTKRVALEVGGILAFASSNLVNVILCLRSRGVRVVWADAICINQSDTDERNAQVQIMREIYRGARRVHIWLDDLPPMYTQPLSGRWDDSRIFDNTADLELFRTTQAELLDDIRRSRLSAQPLDPLPSQDPNPSSPPTQPTGVSEALRIIDGIKKGDCIIQLPFYTVTREDSAQLRAEYFAGLSCINWMTTDPYWSRTWILQEVLVASSDPVIHAGNQFTTTFSGLSAAMRKMRANLFSADVDHEHCCSGLRSAAFPSLFRSTGSILPLATLISFSGQYKLPWSMGIVYKASLKRDATDPRDHVFGLLGLIEESVARDLPVDYTLDAATIFANATRKLYELEGAFGKIDHAGSANRPGQLPGLPSWSLLWSKFEWEQSVFHNQYKAPACGKFGYIAEKSNDPAELVVRTKLVDHIVECADSLPRGSEESDSYFRTLRRWYEKFVTAQGDALDEQKSAFRQTVSYGMQYQQNFGKIESTRRSFAAYLDDIMRDQTPGALSEGPLVQGMCFFCTPDGTFGKAYEGARAGDEIFIMQGCPWPVLLRLVEPGAQGGRCKRYELLSVCYLHGHMDGSRVDESTQWERVALV